MTSSFGKMIDPAHKSMARMLGYCLTLATFDGWQDFTALAYAKLSERELVSLAWAALSGLDRDQAAAVADAVLGGAGAPIPALQDEVDEARFWSEIASADELRAYSLAAFKRLSRRDQADFLDYVRGRNAA